VIPESDISAKKDIELTKNSIIKKPTVEESIEPLDNEVKDKKL